MNIYIIAGIIIVTLFFIEYAFYSTEVTKKWKDQDLSNQTRWWQLFIYYNPSDPRSIVPRRSGLGITLNFAKPIPKVIAIALFIFIILHSLSFL
jgi:uncharacterized membrane protein